VRHAAQDRRLPFFTDDDPDFDDEPSPRRFAGDEEDDVRLTPVELPSIGQFRRR
jgi:hypothetical protein